MAEVLRRLVRRLREHRGAELEDDATLVFLEWQPGRKPGPAQPARGVVPGKARGAGPKAPLLLR